MLLVEVSFLYACAFVLINMRNNASANSLLCKSIYDYFFERQELSNRTLLQKYWFVIINSFECKLVKK